MMPILHTEQELRKIAKDLYDGKIFTSNDPNVIQMSFMVLLFASEEQIPKDIGLIYEYMSEAAPRSINGNPMFFSARFLNNEETDKVKLYLNELKELLKEFEGDQNDSARF
jgi:hypothetical protein